MEEFDVDENGRIFFSLFLGADRYTAPKITITGANGMDILNQLNMLTEPVDPDDPDGVCVLSEITDRIVTIDTMMTLKLPQKNPVPAGNGAGFTAPAQAAPAGKSCAHGPMKYKEGISSKSNEPYKAWFCQAPFGQTKCKAQFVN